MEYKDYRKESHCATTTSGSRRRAREGSIKALRSWGMSSSLLCDHASETTTVGVCEKGENTPRFRDEIHDERRHQLREMKSSPQR